MAEFATGSGFTDCWCGCKADQHKLELSGGRLVHTRCGRCRCVQYDPRVEDESVPVDPPRERPILNAVPQVPAADVMAVPAAVEEPGPATLVLPPGDVLGAWRSWACETCGSRRYDPFECCAAPASPVTLTMTRGHGDG